MILEIMGTTNFNQVAPLCNHSENTPPPATLGCNNSHTTTGGVSTDTQHKKGGFTLVELSIVLIIIGLIVGGVLGGQSLIKSAELQRVVNDLNKYRTAVNAFRLEYNALPGDMDDAQDYWTSCVDSGTNTCNGDGDGIIEWGGGSIREDLRGWQHMSLAGIVPGNYTGEEETVGGKQRLIGGVNLPKVDVDDGLIWYQVHCTGTCTVYDNYKNIVDFQFGASNTGSPSCLFSIFNPKDAKAVDTKIDDGLPGVGNLVAGDGCERPLLLEDSLCVDATEAGDWSNATTWSDENVDGNAADIKYKLSHTGKACRLLYGVIN